MSNSINTNYGSIVALQALNATNKSLATTQNQISTGLKIATAKDNGAVWAIAQSQSAQNSALDAVKDSLNNGKSVIDTTVSAGAQMSDILNQMSQKALAASDAGITADTRKQYQDEYTKLAQTYSNIVTSATFNGVNQIDKNATAVGSSISALGSADGKINVTSGHTDLSAGTLLGASVTTAGAGTGGVPETVTEAAAWSAADASAALTQVNTAIKSVTSAMAGFGVDSKSMDNQLTSVSNLQDSLTTGVGNLVDADMARESASLTALQTKQQLGVQALSVANSSSNTLLSLFRG